MKTILHNCEIDADGAAILPALRTIDGLSGWWTTKVSGSAEVDGIIDFTFRDDFNPQMLVEEAGDGTVWRCVGGHEPWLDNRFHFELRGERPATVFFRQDYSTELGDAAYGRYNFLWGLYLASLVRYVEDGAGHPFRA